jgi:hypothetical protein
MSVLPFSRSEYAMPFHKRCRVNTDRIVFNIPPSWLCVFVREKNDSKVVRRTDSQTDDCQKN